MLEPVADSGVVPAPHHPQVRDSFVYDLMAMGAAWRPGTGFKMIDRKELRKISKARIRDAEALLSARRFDGSVYICGYAIELGLKARICRALKWQGFPFTGKEFNSYRDFKTHDLDVLLHLSGAEEKIKTTLLADWSNVAKWNPEGRYNLIGTASKTEAEVMIKSVKVILSAL